MQILIFLLDNLFFVLVGLAAQLVDGALGMAYGVTSSSLLLAFGLPPAVASASVHAAEVATTGVSGLSHRWFGNVDSRLMWRLALPGMLGGVLGAWLLGSVDWAWLRPLVAAYLLGMGGLLIFRAWRGGRLDGAFELVANGLDRIEALVERRGDVAVHALELLLWNKGSVFNWSGILTLTRLSFMMIIKERKSGDAITVVKAGLQRTK